MRLFFRKTGTGPALIILHGLYGSSDNWLSIAKKLAGNFTVYLPDQRNHGQSPHHPHHDYNMMKDDLYELVREEDLKKFFLAGHSMGGKTAMFFAAEWPEMIDGLLIADISPFRYEGNKSDSQEMHETILKSVLSLDISSITTRKEAETFFTEKIESEKIRSFILKNLERTAEGSFRWRINAATLYNNLGSIMDGMARPDSNTVPITGFPVIFLKAALSSYISENDYSDILRIFPGAEIIQVENSGHWVHADRPDVVADSLLKLLNG